jgi:hypothetical protein
MRRNPKHHVMAWWPWVLLALGLAALCWAAPRAVLSWVVEPSLQPDASGLRLEVWPAGPRPGADPVHRRAADTGLMEVAGQRRLMAYGVWRAAEGGRRLVVLEGRGRAAVWVDGRRVAELPGGDARTRAGLELEPGPHLLVLSLESEPDRGWLRLAVAGPGRARPAPLAGEALPYPDLGNLATWWEVVQVLRSPVWLWTALLAAATLLGALWGRPGLSPLVRPLGRLASSRTRLAWVLFFLVLGVYLLFMGGRLYSLDDSFRFRVTKALATQGDVQITDHAERKHRYSKYGLLHPLAMVPLYAAGQLSQGLWPPGSQPSRVLVSCGMQLVGAAAAVVMYWLLLELGHRRRTALVTALLFALATLAWPYAKHHFTEPLNGLLLLLAFWLAARARLAASRPALWGMGAMVGLAGVNAPAFMANIAPPLAAYAAWLIWPRPGGVCWRWGQSLRWAAGAAAPVAAAAAWTLLYNYLRYGSATDFGYGGEHLFPNLIFDGEPGWSLPWWVGLHGLLLSPGKSVFLYSPLVAAGLWGLARLWRRLRPEAWLLVGLGLAFLAFYAKWATWHGDTAWGPRYLVPAAGLFIIPVAELVAAWRELGPGKQALLAGLALAGAAVQLLGVLVPFDLYHSLVVKADYSNQWHLHYLPHFSPLLGHLEIIFSGEHAWDLYLWGSPLARWLAAAAGFLAAAAAGGAGGRT